MTKAEPQTHTNKVCAHIDAVGASLHKELWVVADDLAALSRKMDQNHRELKTDIAGIDRRLMRVEAAQSRL